MECFETQILPAPATPLTEEAAREWLTGSMPELLNAAGLALTHEDAAVREPWQTLLSDVRELAAACQAVRDGADVMVEVDDPSDADELTAMLARALKARSASHSAPVEGEAAFEALTEVLAERLEAASQGQGQDGEQGGGDKSGGEQGGDDEEKKEGIPTRRRPPPRPSPPPSDKN